MSKINDVFRTAKLPSELTTQSRRPIKVRIGQPISVKAQQEEETLEGFAELLRKKTYLLANVFEKERLIDKVPTTIKIPKVPKKIANAVRVEVLEGEIEKLREKDARLLQSKNYEVFLAQAQDMPFLLKEIWKTARSYPLEKLVRVLIMPLI